MEMDKIQMFDARQDYLTYKEEIDAAIAQVLNSGRFIRDKVVEKFEFEMHQHFGTNVVTCGNGTDALQIALMALDLSEGDEIITTPFTFVATVEVMMLLKLKPVFVDINPLNYTIDTTQIEKAITERTKVILPVHLFGACSNMKAIQNIAKRNNLYVVEDTCQSLGTIWNVFYNWEDAQYAGTMGDIGCTSFFPTKNLGCYGDGGAIFVRDKELYERVKMIANHGSKEKYYYETIGVNSRLDEIQAAILSVKLKYLSEFIFKRNELEKTYNEELRKLFWEWDKKPKRPYQIPEDDLIVLPKTHDMYMHTFNQYTIRTKKREELKSYLSSFNIPTMIYYPLPLHLQQAYKCLGYKEGDFPVSELMSKEVLSLPMHPYLDSQQQHHIIVHIRRFFGLENW
jgi:dTDP-4-amino-4,6-dideoxygalactose transaminase